MFKIINYNVSNNSSAFYSIPQSSYGGNLSFGLGLSKSDKFEPVKRPLPKNKLIIKRTENALYFHAAPVVFGICGLYFLVKKQFKIKDLKNAEILRYTMDRNGKFPERKKSSQNTKANSDKNHNSKV